MAKKESGRGLSLDGDRIRAEIVLDHTSRRALKELGKGSISAGARIAAKLAVQMLRADPESLPKVEPVKVGRPKAKGKEK